MPSLFEKKKPTIWEQEIILFPFGNVTVKRKQEFIEVTTVLISDSAEGPFTLRSPQLLETLVTRWFLSTSEDDSNC